jgi:hypothetical protein
MLTTVSRFRVHCPFRPRSTGTAILPVGSLDKQNAPAGKPGRFAID